MGRKTKQKQILQEAMNEINTFFDAEELNKKAKNIGIATVYRFLKKQEEKGNVYSYICNRRKVYSKEKKSHCHFICEKTGKIIHFEIEDINFLKNKIPGKITSFQLEVKGVCKDCS